MLQNFDGVEYSNFVIAPSVAIVSALVSCHKFSKGLIKMDLDADFGDEEGEDELYLDQSWYMILFLFLWNVFDTYLLDSRSPAVDDQRMNWEEHRDRQIRRGTFR